MGVRFTSGTKHLAITSIALVIIGSLSYANYTIAKQVAKLTVQKPIIITKTIIVTPTITPTAAPSARLRLPTGFTK